MRVHPLAMALLNAREAFKDPIAAAQWWSGAREIDDAEGLPLERAPKHRFDASLSADLRTLQGAATAAVEAIKEGGTPPSDAVTVVSAALSRGSMHLHGNPPALAYSVGDGAGSVLFPLAHALARLIAADLGRLRRCARQPCAVYFWDTTKNASRRWCGLPCMERARAPRRRLRR